MRNFIHTIFTFLLVLPLGLHAQTYTMTNGSSNTCSGNFYDSGGSGGSYGNNETYVYTFCPSTPGDMIQLNFSSFDIESSYDYVYIYDGSTTGSPLIGSYTGTSSPGLVTATNASGCITVEFTSDGSVTYPGWAASVSCVSGGGGGGSNVNMTNGSSNTCSGNFYDSGGSTGSYGNNESYVYTFCPSTPGDMIQLNFSSFDIESSYDYVYIYDGSTTGSPLIGSYTGTSSPGTVTATNAGGCITIEFTSDGSVTYPGWAASVSCVPAGGGGNINMTNGSSSTCSGTFYDSGGAFSDYSNSETYVYTICPDVAGNTIQVDFTSFDIENNFDFLEIFDGNSTAAPSLGTYTGTTSPGTVSATPSNASGCVTFQFTSDGSVTYPGWVANITCNTSCQTINSNLVSTTPAADADGIIRLCQGESVSVTGNGTFSDTGAGATYEWNMGDGTTINGTSATHTYSDSGTYYANLVITDTDGCTNNNYINQEIRISTTPVMTANAAPLTVCTGNSTNLTGTVVPTPYTSNCTPPVAGTTFLPDGSGVSYTSSIPVNCYATGLTVTSPADIQNICLDLEHSYLGDLNIEIICPNGQSATLKEYPGGSNTYLGNPIDDLTSGPGTGFTYCFNSTATTLMVNGPTVSSGSPANPSIQAGNYMPVDPFTNLVGCPVNGNWTIEVTDNLAADDGYIFNWDIDFSASVVGATSFTPTIVSETWEPASGLINTGAGTATVTPTTGGTPYYVYSVTDNFGCTYQDSVQVTINESSTAPALTPMPGTYCPNTSLTLNASGGTAGTGSSIEWYTGPNGTGTWLGSGASYNFTPTTSGQTIYVRREGTCNNTVDDQVTINLKDYVYGLNSTSTSNYCTDNAGWNHFYVGNEIILSVQGDLSGAPAGFPVATIWENATYYQQGQGPFTVASCLSGLTPGEERFEMERSWNLDFGGGTQVPPYNVRFYYRPQEKTDIETAAANWMAANPACGYTYKYAVPNGFYWFKNTGANYTAPDYDGLHLTSGAGTTTNGTNYTEFTGVTSFSGGSGAIILIPNALLDAGWSYFDGETTDNSVNNLRWATEQEVNTSHFNIQRSQDGVNFTTIGTSPAQGNATTTTHYTYDDVHPFEGGNYYRLELIDNNGKVTFSNTILLFINPDDVGYTFHPNPTTDLVYYSYEAAKSELLEIEVVDVLGQVLHTARTTSVAGTNNIQVSLEDYPAGAYLIRVNHVNSANVHTAKIVKKGF